MEKGQPDPEVLAISLEGAFRVEPTQQHEKLVEGGGVGLSGGMAGVSISGDLKLEKTTDRDTSDAATIRGSIDLRGRNWGPKNIASWSLLENKTAKTGVVASMRTAILLRRKNLEHFKSTLTIEVSADTKTKLGSLFKTDPLDDDIWYDPSKDPTDRLRKYDVDNLGAFKLESVSDVSNGTILENTSKTMSLG